MSVVDASVFVDALVGTGQRADAARSELSGQQLLQVPAIFNAECVSAVRGLVLRGDLSTTRAGAAVEQIRLVRSIQYPFEPFIQRAWQLRSTVSVYDAWYVALAEWLQTDLVTADERLLSTSGATCRIRRPRPPEP